jgi:hypothetical protein
MAAATRFASPAAMERAWARLRPTSTQGSSGRAKSGLPLPKAVRSRPSSRWRHCPPPWRVRREQRAQPADEHGEDPPAFGVRRQGGDEAGGAELPPAAAPGLGAHAHRAGQRPCRPGAGAGAHQLLLQRQLGDDGVGIGLGQGAALGHEVEVVGRDHQAGE